MTYVSKKPLDQAFILCMRPGGTFDGDPEPEPVLFTRVSTYAKSFGFTYTDPQLDILIPVSLLKPYHGNKRIIEYATATGPGIRPFKYTWFMHNWGGQHGTAVRRVWLDSFDFTKINTREYLNNSRLSKSEVD